MNPTEYRMKQPVSNWTVDLDTARRLAKDIQDDIRHLRSPQILDVYKLTRTVLRMADEIESLRTAPAPTPDLGDVASGRVPLPPTGDAR